jgi:uncharacterized protein (UPF0332 family)
MFDWEDYLVQALTLAAVGDEAGLRSAISRAYYSAFGLGLRRLRDVEGLPVPQSGAAHKYVGRTFAEDPLDQKRQLIGITLNRLRSARNHADYDDSVNDLVGLSQLSLEDAQRVVNLVRSL